MERSSLKQEGSRNRLGKHLFSWPNFEWQRGLGPLPELSEADDDSVTDSLAKPSSSETCHDNAAHGTLHALAGLHAQPKSDTCQTGCCCSRLAATQHSRL